MVAVAEGGHPHFQGVRPTPMGSQSSLYIMVIIRLGLMNQRLTTACYFCPTYHASMNGHFDTVSRFVHPPTPLP